MSAVDRLGAWLTARIDPTIYGLMRLFFGLAAVCKFTGFYSVVPRIVKGDFHYGFPMHRYTSAKFPPGLLPGEWVSTPDYATYFHVEEAALVAAVLVTLGVASRLSTVALAGCSLWLLLVDPAGFKHNLFAIACFGFLIAASPCGDRASVDAVVRRALSARGLMRPLPALRSAFALRLVQAQVGVLYFFSTLVKVSDGWFTGHLLSYSADEVARRVTAAGYGFVAPLVLFRPLYAVSAWAIVLVEGFLVVGFFVPRWRRATIAVGIALHVGIDLGVDVGSYSLTMFALYIAFIDPRPRHLHVVAPPRAARALRALDWLRRLRVETGTPGAPLVVAHASGAAADALAVYERLPVTFLPAVAWRALCAVRAWRRRAQTSTTPPSTSTT